MNRLGRIAATVALAGAPLGACRSSARHDAPGRTAARADSAATAAVLIAADRAFASASAARGAAAWAEAWAPNGSIADADSLITGPEAVFRHISPLLLRYGARFSWDPDDVGVLWPDSLGYTIGHALIASDADTAVWAGEYLTVWMRGDDGWDIALDASLPPCDNPPHGGDFDFWLGEWNVDQRIRTEEGRFEAYRATDRVGAVARGCIVVESWQGTVRFSPAMETPQAIRGASVRIYDSRDNLWRIYWIDTMSRKFGDPFVGRFIGGVGDFTPRARSDVPRRRIRFETLDDVVLWELAIQELSGDWKQFWTMRFTRASPRPVLR